MGESRHKAAQAHQDVSHTFPGCWLILLGVDGKPVSLALCCVLLLLGDMRHACFCVSQGTVAPVPAPSTRRAEPPFAGTPKLPAPQHVLSMSMPSTEAVPHFCEHCLLGDDVQETEGIERAVITEPHITLRHLTAVEVHFLLSGKT